MDVLIGHLQFVRVPVVREATVAALDHGAAVTGEVVRRVETRDDRVPRPEIDPIPALGRVHGLERRFRRRAALFRNEADCVSVAGAEIQREPPLDGPAVLHIAPQRVREILRGAIRLVVFVTVVIGVHRERDQRGRPRRRAVDQLIVADEPLGEPGLGAAAAVARADLPIRVRGRVVEARFEVVVAREEIRLVPRQPSEGVVAPLERIDPVVRVAAREAAGQQIRGGRVVRVALARHVPDPGARLQRHELVAPDALPLDLARRRLRRAVHARVVRRELVVRALAALPDVLDEADELVRLVHLIRDLPRVEVLEHVGHRRRHAVVVEGVERQHALLAAARRVVEPELVPDDPSAELAAAVPARVHRVAARDAARPQLVVHIVEFQVVVGSEERAIAVELIAARLQDHVDLQTLGRRVGRVANGRNRRFLDGGIVVVIAALRSGLGAACHDAFHGDPLLAELAEHLELWITCCEAPVQLRTRTRRLNHEGDDAVAAGRNDLQRFARQLRGGGRRGHVHQRCLAGNGDRLRERAHFEHDVHSGGEPRRDPQVGTPHGPKTFERVLDGVDAQRQRGETILASLVRDVYDLFDLERRAGRGNRDARQHGAGVVGDLPDDAGLLRLCGDRNQTRG